MANTGVVDTLTLVTPGAKYTTPKVNFAGGSPTVAATATTTGVVDGATVTSPGTGFTGAPTVNLAGGGGSGAVITAAVSPTGLTITNGGSGYTLAPIVTIAGGGGTGATAVATLSINGIALTNNGSGYTSVPVVTITDLTGAGTGATATANLAAGSAFNFGALATALPNIFVATQEQIIVPEPAYPVGNGNSPTANYSRIQDTSMTAWVGGAIGSLSLTNPGAGYSAAPQVGFQGGGGSGATASASFVGAYVNGVALLTGGAGYSFAPTVTFTGGGGNGAAATALFAGAVNGVTVNTVGSGYNRVPLVSFTGGGGSGAAATVTGKLETVNVVNGGSGYTSAPTVSFTGGGGTGAAATAAISGVAPRRVTGFTITNRGSGYTTAPTVALTGGGGSGATANSKLRVATVNITAGGANYTTPPTVVFNNTGTGGSGAAGTSTLSGHVTGLLLTANGSGYSAAPAVGFTGGGTPTTAATAMATFIPGLITGLTLTNGGTGYTGAPTVVFTGTHTTPAVALAGPPTTPYDPKAIQELFTLDYGRMNATLGVEIKFTNFLNQTTIPYGYIDPPTELFQNGDTIIWKITHNGVDTHFIHFHLFTVQVINRVGWDGMIKPPDANEMAWKDTVRMNPLEDVIIAMRPMKQTLPWELPDSVRPLDVTQPIGTALPNQFTTVDPANNPVTVVNDLTNFGYEYVWHCHILGHEENDMMRPMLFAVPPDAPGNFTATKLGSGNTQRVFLSWKDNAINETGFTVERATALTGPWQVIDNTIPAAPGTGKTVTFTDTTIARRTSYYYRVTANNLVGYTRTFAAPAIGWPTLSADSAPVNAPNPVVINAPIEEAPIFANGFETGLGPWSGVVGNVQTML